MIGRIQKALSGFYYVMDDEGQSYTCKPRGIFRKEERSPFVGDIVKFQITDPKDYEGVIEEILPRKNLLHRPTVANVDQALVVFAICEPKIHLGLLDRFLLHMEKENLACIICFNKLDLDQKQEARLLLSTYESIGYQTLCVSTKTKEGIPDLIAHLTGKLTVIAGPSGVGKSSLINLLAKRDQMQIGDLSKKIRRGKQTTRHIEILPIDSHSMLIDTPGFSSLVVPDIKKEELASCFREFRPFLTGCRFAGCSHIHEPDCALRSHMEALAPSRYESYQEIYLELQARTKY